MQIITARTIHATLCLLLSRKKDKNIIKIIITKLITLRLIRGIRSDLDKELVSALAAARFNVAIMRDEIKKIIEAA